LVKLDPLNKETLHTINSALFAVSLESFSTPADKDISHRIMFHGQNGHNRWFDKSLSFIFMNNGHGGCNGEVCIFLINDVVDLIAFSIRCCHSWSYYG
jgi:hypothetical protein